MFAAGVFAVSFNGNGYVVNLRDARDGVTKRKWHRSPSEKRG